MQASDLRALQAPLKERYKTDPGSALITLRAEGRIGEGIACKVDTGRALVEAGLHPATGGSGTQACSGDMLLEALVACAGVTLKAVATALAVPLGDAKVMAEGDLDFRGTLGVAKDAAVGFREIRLAFHLDSDAPEEQKKKLIELTERYCVVLPTSRGAPRVAGSVNCGSSGSTPPARRAARSRSRLPVECCEAKRCGWRKSSGWSPSPPSNRCSRGAGRGSAASSSRSACRLSWRATSGGRRHGRNWWRTAPALIAGS
jgi:uncharacterized OsmC-like protein